MKKKILILTWIFSTVNAVEAQVTQINSNKSLEQIRPLSNSKSVFVSRIDQHLWVSDGTQVGTVELSDTLIYRDGLGSIGFLDGKFIFAGSSPSYGDELFITDGTPGGTTLLKDIYPGPSNSFPDANAAVLNGFLYFTAERPAEGRELWRTDGTTPGTTFVKDIITGTTGSNYPGKYRLFSTGTYLLFMARTPSSGVELWKSDGTGPGTVILKDINPGPDSSGVLAFSRLNNLVLFQANDGSHGLETWKSDGTPGGTTILKDINPGPVGSGPFFGFTYFFIFNGKAYFNANDGVNGEEIWSTDGTELNTSLLKNIETNPFGSLNLLTGAVIAGNKFFFASTNLFGSRYELWQSDGTPGGTTLFKDFTDGGNIPFLFPYYNGNGTQGLFQGNKFFFAATTSTEGNELWVSNGVDSTAANTHIVTDLNSGSSDGIGSEISYFYTADTFYFAGNDGTHGNELWKTNGTPPPGTAMVADVFVGPDSSEAQLCFFAVNGHVLFTANNGDSPTETDLYSIGGGAPVSPVYTFTGNGNWNLPANWSGGVMPPATPASGSQIVIDPVTGGECLLNITYTVPAGVSLTVKANKRFRIPGILNISN